MNLAFGRVLWSCLVDSTCRVLLVPLYIHKGASERVAGKSETQTVKVFGELLVFVSLLSPSKWTILGYVWSHPNRSRGKWFPSGPSQRERVPLLEYPLAFIIDYTRHCCADVWVLVNLGIGHITPRRFQNGSFPLFFTLLWILWLRRVDLSEICCRDYVAIFLFFGNFIYWLVK